MFHLISLLTGGKNVRRSCIISTRGWSSGFVFWLLMACSTPQASSSTALDAAMVRLKERQLSLLLQNRFGTLLMQVTKYIIDRDMHDVINKYQFPNNRTIYRRLSLIA